MKSRGFVMLEVILAITFFSIAATSLVVALQKTSDLAMLSEKETAIARILDSALVDAISQPYIEVGETVKPLNEFGSEKSLEVISTVEELELENTDGQLLSEMYIVKVKAVWFEDGVNQEREVFGWRYAPLYLPQ